VEKDINAVAIEADWPDAYRVNRYVRGTGSDHDGREALAGFKRFPAWMWRNTVVVEFVEWLRAHNDALPAGAPKVGFYGLDLYSLRTSMEEVIRYLEKVDPDAVAKVREQYSCFDHFGEDGQIYGLVSSVGLANSCEEEVISVLLNLQRRTADAAQRTAGINDDELFNAQQNARVVKNAEQYYRSMFLEKVSTWNLRDTHMAETFEELVNHLERDGRRAKAAIWAHNSHLGDARATEMGRRGELNLGELLRKRYHRDVRLIGFTTHHGTVTAASDWGGIAERKTVRPALPTSYEELFHETGLGRFMVTWIEGHPLTETLRDTRLERAIGVIYRPDTERQSHYFLARLPDQFDAVLHIDETHALEPLERTSEWDTGEVPETFPFAV
jgi:erythromycin esterase-like protein